MQLRDNGLRFSPITIVLHWLVAALLFSILGLGVAIAQSPGEARLMQLQNMLGTLLFLVSIYRFWARVTSRFFTVRAATKNAEPAARK